MTEGGGVASRGGGGHVGMTICKKTPSKMLTGCGAPPRGFSRRRHFQQCLGCRESCLQSKKAIYT